jgi:hypothetical protein
MLEVSVYQQINGRIEFIGVCLPSNTISIDHMNKILKWFITFLFVLGALLVSIMYICIFKSSLYRNKQLTERKIIKLRMKRKAESGNVKLTKIETIRQTYRLSISHENIPNFHPRISFKSNFETNWLKSSNLNEINSKLSVYMKRNSWLIKSQFTANSLVVLSEYYQRSRLVYGMSCYMDQGEILDKVEKHAIQYVKSVLGLNNSCNSDRVRVALY